MTPTETSERSGASQTLHVAMQIRLYHHLVIAIRDFTRVWRVVVEGSFRSNFWNQFSSIDIDRIV